MRKTVSYILTVLASLLLLVAMLFTCLQLCMNDEGWFRAEYEKLGTAPKMGISLNDLSASMTQLVDYMEGRADTIQLTVRENGQDTEMFNQREIDHMVDVRALFLAWRSARTAIAVLGCLLLIAAVLLNKKRQVAEMFAKSYLIALVLLIVVIAALGLWAALDFTSFWTAFHHLFFSNDLWLLDPATSRMINMCPEQLFSDIVLRFALWFVGVACLVAFVSAAYLAVKNKRRKKPMTKRS